MESRCWKNNKITDKITKMVEPHACAGGTLGFGPLGTQSPSYSRDDLVCVQKEMGVVLALVGCTSGGGGGTANRKVRGHVGWWPRVWVTTVTTVGHHPGRPSSSFPLCPV